MILSIAQTIDGNTTHLIVCICRPTAPRVSGSVQIKCDANHRVMAKLHSLFVAEPDRRNNIATELMDTAEEIARREGCESIGLHIGLANLDVRHFYKKLGYAPVYQFDDGDVQLVKRLEPFTV